MFELTLRHREKPKERISRPAPWPFEMMWETHLLPKQAVDALREGQTVFHGWHFASGSTVHRFGFTSGTEIPCRDETETVRVLLSLSGKVLSEQECSTIGVADALREGSDF